MLMLAWSAAGLAIFALLGWAMTQRRLERQVGRADALDALLRSEMQRTSSLLETNYQLAVWNEELHAELARYQWWQQPLHWN